MQIESKIIGIINDKLKNPIYETLRLLNMRTILTKADHLKSNDFYHQSLNFIWVRSLAINTMRHGAPLDLDF